MWRKWLLQGNLKTVERGGYRMCSRQPSVVLAALYLKKKHFILYKQPILYLTDDCTRRLVERFASLFCFVLFSYWLSVNNLFALALEGFGFGNEKTKIIPWVLKAILAPVIMYLKLERYRKNINWNKKSLRAILFFLIIYFFVSHLSLLLNK